MRSPKFVSMTPIPGPTKFNDPAPLQASGQWLLTADVGSFAFTGNDVTFAHGYVLAGASASFPFTGLAVGLTASKLLAFAVGSFPFTGQPVALRASRVVAMTTTNFPFTGNDATLTFTPAPGGGDGGLGKDGYDSATWYDRRGRLGMRR